jgi:hypothetical protein
VDDLNYDWPIFRPDTTETETETEQLEAPGSTGGQKVINSDYLAFEPPDDGTEWCLRDLDKHGDLGRFWETWEREPFNFREPAVSTIVS